MDSFSNQLIIQFTSAASMSKVERAIKKIDIYEVYGLLKQKFDRELYGVELFSEDKEQLVRNTKFELTFIKSTLEGLEPYKSEERELLLKYRDHIIDKAELDIVKEDFPQIFTSERAYKFFIKTIKHFDAVDENLKYKRGGQKIFDVIRESQSYRKYILLEPFKFRIYSEEIGRIVGKKFSGTNFTSYDSWQLPQINAYFKKNYPID